MTVSLEYLLKHIDKCPFAWSDGLHRGKILVHKNTSQEEILSWLKKLNDLKKIVKEQQCSVLDVRSKEKRSIRTM